MVRILSIGDFHGKFPKKWINFVKKEKIDLVVSNGDYPPFFYRKLWFKHCYGKDVGLWEVVGKKKYLELVKEDLRRAERAVAALNKMPVPVFTTLGNMDYPNIDDIVDAEEFDEEYEKWGFDYTNAFIKMLKKYKNITRVDYTSKNFGDYVVIGARGHSVPGKVKSKAYKKHRKILDDLFKKHKKENNNRKVIFLTHNMPYKTKLDKIGKHAHKAVRGKHVGSKMFRRIINRYQPVVHTGGHIHEAKGKQYLGKTLCVNAGAIHEGEASVIEIPDNGKGKVKVRFVEL